MRKIKISFLIVGFFLLCGCSSEIDERSKIISENIDSSDYQTKEFDYLTCSRELETQNGEEVTNLYEVYYNDKKEIEVLKSYEKVQSSDINILTQYEQAYKKIYSAYEGLDYYENDVTSTKDSVTSITYINYGKIDLDRLMEIEGSEDNVKVTNGKIKLADWRSFAKKYGTVCKK